MSNSNNTAPLGVKPKFVKEKLADDIKEVFAKLLKLPPLKGRQVVVKTPFKSKIRNVDVLDALRRIGVDSKSIYMVNLCPGGFLVTFREQKDLDLIFPKYNFIEIGEFCCDLELPVPDVEGVRVRFSRFPEFFDDEMMKAFVVSVLGIDSGNVLLTKAYFRRGVYTGSGVAVFKARPERFVADAGILDFGEFAKIQYKVLPPRSAAPRVHVEGAVPASTSYTTQSAPAPRPSNDVVSSEAPKPASDKPPRPASGKTDGLSMNLRPKRKEDAAGKSSNNKPDVP